MIPQVSELTREPVVPKALRYVAGGDNLGRVEVRCFAVNRHPIVALNEDDAQEETTDDLRCQPKAQCLQGRQHTERTAQKEKVMKQ